MKNNRSVRFEENDLAQARELGLDLAEIARRALKFEILKRTKKCPTCGCVLK